MISHIIEVTSKNFVEQVIKASENLPVIVDFWAPWCSPCKQLTPIIEKAVNAHSDKVILAKINIEENQSIASQMQIQSIPMVYAFFNGQVVDGFQGNIPESEVNKFVKKISELTGPNPEIKENLDKLEIFIENSNWEEALGEANSILDIDPNNLDACYGKLVSLIGINKFDDAKEFMSTLPNEIMNEKKINELSSKLEISEKSFEASKNLSDLKKSLEDSPNDIQAHIDLSNALFGVGEISNCYSTLINAIKIDPEWNNQEARKKLLSFINSHDLASEEARKARRQLSSILFN
tara:strand:+ start:103 stop:981 length:879 start_codon:yes stop_codon:yes gene_type:complete